MFTAHNLLGAFFTFLVAFIVCTGFVPVSQPGQRVPESVRANPASYRPVYIPTTRGSGSGGGGGWSGGK